MAEKKNNTARNLGGGLLLGLLAVSLVGFGVDGLGGTVRSIGQAGDREISTDDYFRALQQELRVLTQQLGRPVTLDQAITFGVDQQVRAQLVTAAVLDHETQRLGISVGDDVVQRELLAVPNFRGVDGNFDRETYRFTLQNANLSAVEFEEQLRLDAARGILQAAVVGGVTAPDAQVDLLAQYVGEQRAFSVLTLTRSDLDEALPAPTDAQIEAFYEENLDRYTLPAAKRIDYAWLTPAMLLDEVTVDEDMLRSAYDSRLDEFVQPERRLVERLVFPDQAAAQAAMDRLTADEVSFEDLVAERDLTLEDADMGDVAIGQLGEAGPSVFAMDTPGVTGPHASPLGPAIFRMNAILAAQEVPFEEAIPELRDELALDRARREISDTLDQYEDLLAGGATIAQLTEETRMQGGQIDWRAGDSEGIAGYAEFRAAAEALAVGDFAEIGVLADGGIFALSMVEEIPEAPRPLADVQVRVIEDWEVAETRTRLLAQADTLRAALESGDSFEDLSLAPERFEGITRDASVPDLPRALITEVFAMPEGAVTRLPGDAGRVHVVALHDISAPDAGSDDIVALRDTLDTQIAQGVAQDVFTYFARALEVEAGVTLNQSAIQAVHNNF
ncbi:peptidyl-prolyl cis-trans isomerase [Roseicitreum antarcticum]|uniref:Peptidyl-prolyl cis-trans isomerase D n=1 Tax=Roseicitreum antarcticum TaxID=564137 RepID=A0A1H3C799_9RHOB|nr:peptidyl-prolyl cis-trans isomerase [Roseicitreum antarcticum]SDX49955.1 peptidyl-prolyl cis-trans isomerase D [Roseicitreum antarcticum]